jgi:Tol biopolymer transport system component
MPGLNRATYLIFLTSILSLAITFASPLCRAELPQAANEKNTTEIAKEAKIDKEPRLPLVPTRKLEYIATEGTWVSLDISPDGKTIVFDLVGHLYEMPITGGEAKAITSGLSFDSLPRFSPDGKMIAYVSDRSGANNLWVSNADGSQARPLTGDENSTFTSPSWTPDSSYVLVSQKKPSYYDSAFELWMYDLKGGTGVRVSKAKATEDASPESWHNALGAVSSPDGHYIYYASKSGYFSDDIKFPLWQITRRDLRTGEEDVITSNQGSAIRPLLSPDGTTLVYATRYDAGTALRIHNLTTGEERWLKYPVQRDDQESYFSNRDLFPGYAFTPDGKSVVLAYGGKIHRIRLSNNEDSVIPFHASVVRELGPKLDFRTRIDEGPVQSRLIQGAVESPDGKQLAFSALTHLYTLSLSGGVPRRLTHAETTEYQPSWSPDAKWVAYVSWDDEKGYLWKTLADGSGSPIQLTDVPAYYTTPCWSPDGSRVIAMRASRTTAMEQVDQWGKPISGLELISIPADGGAATTLAFAAQDSFPQFNTAGDRIFVTETHKKKLLESESTLVSMRIDGSDKRTQLILHGKEIWGADFSPNVQILPSPDEKSALALYRGQVYLFDLPHVGGEPPTIDLSAPAVAVRRLTNLGADFISWADHGKTIAWSLGASYFRLPLETAEAGLALMPANAAKDPKSPDGNLPESARALHPQELHVKVVQARYTPTGTVLLKGAKIITMHGDQIIESGDILIHDNRIAAVGADGSIPLPPGATTIDLTGKIIVPGFIDTHPHWTNIRRGVLDTQNWDFLTTLAYGITAGRDPQTFTNDIFAYQDLVDTGEILGPRAYSTGPGIFWVNDFHSEEEAEEVIHRYKDYYRTETIKSYLVGNRKQREYVVEASNKLHMMPTTEGAADLALDITHVIDGFSGAEHQFPMALHQDLVELVAKSGVYYDPTYIIGYGGPASENHYFETTDIHGDAKVRHFVPHVVVDEKTSRMTWYRPDEYAYSKFAKSADEIVKAGGKVCVGGHGEFQGLSFHWELWSLQSGGMSNLEALRAATFNGAEAMGHSQDLGSIEAGKLADLVVLDKDPLQDIRNSTSIHFVMKNGELLEGDTLNEVWPKQKTAGPYWWWSDEPQ